MQRLHYSGRTYTLTKQEIADLSDYGVTVLARRAQVGNVMDWDCILDDRHCMFVLFTPSAAVEATTIPGAAHERAQVLYAALSGFRKAWKTDREAAEQVRIRAIQAFGTPEP